MTKKVVTDLAVAGKKVLVRADFNVPMKDGEITNDNRIVQAMPTIEYLIENNAKVILFSHLGKVKTEEDKAKLSLRPVATRLASLLNKEVKFVPETRGEELEEAINALKDGEVLVFENTRFEDVDGKKESKNDPELGKYWASLGDLFVNDAFGTAHRAHASNIGVASHLESAAGFLMDKEIKFIGGAVDEPQRPFVAILGGAKVSDKIGVIENLLEKADKVIIGGGMAYTFAKAQGKEIGASLLEADKIDLAKELMAGAGDKLILPIDATIASDFSNDAVEGTVPMDEIPADMQ
ncbi:phosphoglycerate kinase, partial [Jeotgalibaca porci]|uniref:phosphoglycerate kinase n=1 Tax=Jeotgalibaca porci TaxID=1868793 RepID=UPI00359FC774